MPQVSPVAGSQSAAALTHESEASRTGEAAAAATAETHAGRMQARVRLSIKNNLPCLLSRAFSFHPRERESERERDLCRLSAKEAKLKENNHQTMQMVSFQDTNIFPVLFVLSLFSLLSSFFHVELRSRYEQQPATGKAGQQDGGRKISSPYASCMHSCLSAPLLAACITQTGRKRRRRRRRRESSKNSLRHNIHAHSYTNQGVKFESWVNRVNRDCAVAAVASVADGAAVSVSDIKATAQAMNEEAGMAGIR